MKSALESLNREFNLFKEIRGAGLLLGCELRDDYAGRSRDLLALLMEEGMLALVAGDSVLRLAPPLVVTEQDLQLGIERMTSAVKRFTTT